MKAGYKKRKVDGGKEKGGNAPTEETHFSPCPSKAPKMDIFHKL